MKWNTYKLQYRISHHLFRFNLELLRYVPFCAAAFQNTFAWVLWRFTFRIAHAMVKHTPSTFHPSHLFETIFKTIGGEFACSTLIEFFREKFVAVPDDESEINANV